jgi:hypothetical protein
MGGRLDGVADSMVDYVIEEKGIILFYQSVCSVLGEED